MHAQGHRALPYVPVYLSVKHEKHTTASALRVRTTAKQQLFPDDDAWMLAPATSTGDQKARNLKNVQRRRGQE